MIGVDSAVEIILKSVRTAGSEKVPLLESAGRTLAADVISPVSVPPLDNSAMDGYALRAQETGGASPDSPRVFRIAGEIQAGGSSILKVEPGTAVRIMTGAPIPEGADAVVMIEHSIEEYETVLIFSSAKKHENIRFAGEDIAAGQTVLRKGELISPANAGLLASMDITFPQVYKKPVIAIISTGNEVAEPGSPMRPGQIRNSNAYTLYAEITAYGGIPRYMGIAEDSPEATAEILSRCLDCDFIITTGGVSMGKYDFIREVLENMGGEILFEKIRMKPGKPLIFGKLMNSLFFGLPGNPVSCLISFIQFVRPAMLRFSGRTKIDKPLVNAVLKNDIRKKPERRHFLRGFFTVENGEFHAATTGPQGSGILRSMSEANCLIIVREGVELIPAGSKVEIQLINHGEL